VSPEGDVLVVDESVDILERLRRETPAPNVSYLIGSVEVLPLTDASVDEVLANDVPRTDGAAESFRVLRSGGVVAFAAGDEDRAGGTLNLDAREVERLFTDAGFDAVSVTDAGGALVVAARKP
jgi:ubiquinone/menaquinone biosynthesis C-methylase UbiE